MYVYYYVYYMSLCALLFMYGVYYNGSKRRGY